MGQVFVKPTRLQLTRVLPAPTPYSVLRSCNVNVKVLARRGRKTTIADGQFQEWMPLTVNKEMKQLSQSQVNCISSISQAVNVSSMSYPDQRLIFRNTGAQGERAKEGISI